MEHIKRNVVLALLISSLLLVGEVMIGGVSLCTLIVLILTLCLACLHIRRIVPDPREVRRIMKRAWPVYALPLIALFRLAGSLFSQQNLMEINLEVYILLIVFCLLYKSCEGEEATNLPWIDVVICAGGVMCLMTLLGVLGVMPSGAWSDFWSKSSGEIASYVVPIGIFSVWGYCFHKERNRRIVSAAVAAMAFFVLLLNQNHISLWMMAFVFLTIPCIYRPRAELIKRDMQLFFLFLFLWCNMSLLVNYTDWIPIPLSYDLESSVYMELVLALGGVVFFHFWDRLPEGKDQHMISMVKLQHYFRRILCGLALFFISMAVGGGFLPTLPDQGIYGVCKCLFLPLIQELQPKESSFFILLRELGLLAGILLLSFLVMTGREIFIRMHRDKKVSNLLFLQYLIFTAAFLLWKVSPNAIPLYVFILAWGSSGEEAFTQIKEKRITWNGGKSEDESN